MTTPFNLKDFLAGAPAETLSGIKAIGHHVWVGDLKYQLAVKLESGYQLSYTKNGEVVDFGSKLDNLVMSKINEIEVNND